MRKVLETKQLVLDLLASVGGVLQEAATLGKVKKDKLSMRCGEVVAVVTEIAKANGVEPRQLADAVKIARRRFEDGEAEEK